MDISTNIKAVCRPKSEANALPNAHYIDPTVFEEEKHALLFSGWADLGVAANLSDDIYAAYLYLAHAYVLALEQGRPAATNLRTRLVANNRDHATD